MTTRMAGSDQHGRVLVSYAGPDRLWGEWLGEQMERLGRHVEHRGGDSHPSASLRELMDQGLQNSDQLVVVFSSAYLRAGHQPPDSWQGAVDWALEHRDAFIPVLVGRCDLLPRFWQLAPVDLHEVSDEREARRRLLDRLQHSSHGTKIDTELLERSMTRYPGRQPAVWSPRLPGRNAYFTGRDGMLDRIRSLLTSDVTALLPHSLQGLAGVGKTQLAIEYAFRFAADYDVVWWVPAVHVAEARNALAELAPHLGLPVTGETGEVMRAVLDALRTGEPYLRWLLIFDNAEEPADIQPLLLSGPGHTLITSRNQSWQDLTDSVDVDVYSREESLEFLCRRVRGLTEADASSLAVELGDLPLALEHAAGWLATTGATVEHYLGLLRDQILTLFSTLQPGGYRELVAGTWSVSINQLRDECPAADDLLSLCAFFDSPIHLDLLVDAPVEVLPESLGPVLQSESLRAEALSAIRQYSLARIDQDPNREPYLHLHRLVQALVRQLLSPAQQEAYRSSVHRLLAAAAPGDPRASASGPRYAELLPHVLSSGAVQATTPKVRQLVLNILTYLQVRGEYKTCLNIVETASARWRAELSDVHPDSCSLIRHQGDALRSLGRSAEAMRADEELYDKLRGARGADDPLTLRASSGLASSHRRLGNFREARALDEETLDRYRRLHGPDHADTLRATHNLAVDLRMFGEFQAALALDQDNAQRRERVLGPDHLSTLFSHNNVARDLRELGDYYGSVALQENIYARYRELFGADAPDTLRAMKNLSVSRRKAGRYRESSTLADEVLIRHRRRFGDTYVETLAATTNLANEYRCLDQYSVGKGFAEQAVAGFRQALGDDHPYTGYAEVNLAILLRLTGSPDQARELNEQALAKLRDALGADHRYTLSCLVNLASDRSELGDVDDARLLGEEAVERLRVSSGRDHPYTLAAELNLALDLRKLRERDAYSQLIESVLSRFKQALGSAHPETLAAAARTRAACDIEPPPT